MNQTLPKFNYRNYLLIFLVPVLIFSCGKMSAPDVTYREKTIDRTAYDMVYEIGNWNHPDYGKPFSSLGNHRILIETPSSTLTQVILPWRRRDNEPNKKAIYIVDAKTNKPIENKYAVEINNEYGHLIFEPNEGSTSYYVYYYPHTSTGGYYPKLTYDIPEDIVDQTWFSDLNLSEEQLTNLPSAEIIKAESLDEFHSFFPMEIISTKDEQDGFTTLNPKAYYLFPEYRERPIKMQDYLPVHWTKSSTPVNGLSDKASRGEYYTFQIGLFSPATALNNIQIAISELNGSLPSESMTCFNTEGVDLNGKEFKKEVSVQAGKVQPLWFGIEIPEDAKPGICFTQVIIRPEGLVPDTAYVKLEVSSDVIANYGDDAPENMSRMRWLNSTIGTDPNDIIKPFTPVAISDKTLGILGREIELNEFGLPNRISSFFTQEMTKLKEDKEEILSHPMEFHVVGNEGSEEWNTDAYKIRQQYQSQANWQASHSSENFNMNVNGTLEYDGMLEYSIQLIAKETYEAKNMMLRIPMLQDASKYILGLGLKGGEFSGDLSWKWNVKNHHEGAWLGAVNKGLQFVLRDENYERPLNTNFYQNKPLNLPPSWYNEGNGGINISTENGFTTIDNYSGARRVRKGDTLNFNIRFFITPFKTLDTKDHFNTRFVHKYVPVDSVEKWNGTIVNVHHANEINPYINYPFFALEKQKAYIDEAHNKGIKVKLYNTIRELTYKSHELFALKSLGDEILNDGEGGGHSWLQEHFKSNYHSAWHAWRVNDAAILNKGTSRWTNYYIEGINWLAKNQKIDGLYLDDIAFSRATVKRIASVFNAHRDSYVIDLHSANQYNPRDGFINSAFLYMEHFPYISRLWFGEYFEYDLAPDYWFTEVSGLPFGLTGEMLEKGGHPYRGLVYGMTTRVYGNFNPEAIWKVFDDFGIAEAEMLGYWVDQSPIKTNHPGIKNTIYQRSDKVLISMGSWSDENENVELNIDWDKLGFTKEEAILRSPVIEPLQGEQVYDLNKRIRVPENQGLILILEKRN